MNDFRSRILSGRGLGETGLLRGKTPSNRTGGDNLEAVNVPRTESRTVNHRDADRHRLSDERVYVRHGRKRHECRLINLSGGGAMVEGPFRPEMWDRVDLELGSSGAMECAVRWLKGDRIGLEFAHETRIEASREKRLAILRAVLARSFPDIALEDVAQPIVELAPTRDAPNDPDGKASRRTEPRHPLIWGGEIHFDHTTRPVRLRNISATGAMVEIVETLPVGAQLHLDLGEAGALFASVSWARGDQAGLQFDGRFDLMRLASVRPQVAPGRWTKPDYLRDESTDTSPWASQWGRLSLPELHRTLKR